MIKWLSMFFGFLPCMAFGTLVSYLFFFAFPLITSFSLANSYLLSRGSNTLSVTLIVEELALAATSFLVSSTPTGKLLSPAALKEDVHHWKILLNC